MGDIQEWFVVVVKKNWGCVRVWSEELHDGGAENEADLYFGFLLDSIHLTLPTNPARGDRCARKPIPASEQVRTH